MEFRSKSPIRPVQDEWPHRWQKLEVIESNAVAVAVFLFAQLEEVTGQSFLVPFV